jgi:subtilisin family serine protease
VGHVVRALALVIAVLLLFGITAPSAAAAPGPPDHPEWWFDTWHVPALWAGGARGQGIVIGEIDTGVNAGLPELSANVAAGTDLGSLGGDGRTDRDTDEFGHGTAMASLMVAHDGQDNILGIAPDARILPIAVPITGTTDDAGDNAADLLLTAIRWAADHGAKIISMSLGGPRDPGVSRSCPAKEQSTIDYALSKGAIVVASGGNSGDSGSPIEEPSVCLGVVSVGAVDSAGVVPVWSSKHPYLTVTAPGVDVPTISRVPGEAFFGDGTSQAAAITSGGLAVIWSKYPQLTGRQVVARLLATVDSKQTTRDSALGYGLINIAAAVNNSVPVDAPNPVFAAADPFRAQDAAVAAAPAAPKVRPATTRTKLPGSFAVAPAPDPLTSGPGLGGLVGAAVGLACLAFLIVGATRRRRAFAGAAQSVFDPPTVPFMPVSGAVAPDTPTPVWQSDTPLEPSDVDSPEMAAGVSSPPSVGPVSPEADDAPEAVDSPAQSGQVPGVSSLAPEPESPPTPNAATGDVAS